jgi:hypothetical protein
MLGKKFQAKLGDVSKSLKESKYGCGKKLS